MTDQREQNMGEGGAQYERIASMGLVGDELVEVRYNNANVVQSSEVFELDNDMSEYAMSQGNANLVDNNMIRQNPN